LLKVLADDLLKEVTHSLMGPCPIRPLRIVDKDFANALVAYGTSATSGGKRTDAGYPCVQPFSIDSAVLTEARRLPPGDEQVIRDSGAYLLFLGNVLGFFVFGFVDP
jgi:hypothetical protein